MTENLLLVSIDSLRADHCGFLKESSDLTPNLDRMAAEGVAFENAVSPGPRTPSALPPIFTGEHYNFEGHSLHDHIERREEIGEHLSRFRTVASDLQEAGYTTVGFTANPWTAVDTQFDAGFSQFYELFPGGNEDVDSLPPSSIASSLDDLLHLINSEQFLRWDRKREWFSHWMGFEEFLSERLQELPEPYFVWVFIMDSHQPYLVPPSIREESTFFETYYGLYKFWFGDDEEVPTRAERALHNSYADTVRSADMFVGRLREELPSEECTMMVHSDHGEAFGEHDTYGHEYQLYDENVHVPLLIHDGSDEERISAPISLSRLRPLLSEIAVSDDVNYSDFTSEVVFSRVESQQVAEERAREKQYDPHTIAVRTADWTLIDGANGTELYESENEQDTVGDKYTEIKRTLRLLARSHDAHLSERNRLCEAARVTAQSIRQR
jgi:arylsulfatase A-like enzyme